MDIILIGFVSLTSHINCNNAKSKKAHHTRWFCEYYSRKDINNKTGDWSYNSQILDRIEIA